MSATNLDLPVLIAPEQIRRREFVTIRRGYDPDQVRDYLEQLADQVELMQSLLREARMQAEAASRAGEAPKVDPYEELARRVSGVIREADAAAERIRGEASQEAERVVRDARADADRIRTDAQARAEETRAAAEEAVKRAREQADRTIAGLSTHREALMHQLAAMRERLVAVARDLEQTIAVGGDELPAAPEVWAAPEVVDVRGEDERTPGPERGADRSTEHLFAGLDDPAYEELWEQTSAMRIEMPDIPPLDLDWGSDPGDPELD
jgi:cell division initiation protein